VSASAMPAQRSRGRKSASVTARITVRMSNGFFRSALAATEKMSPTVVKSLDGCVCGNVRTSRSRGSSDGAGRAHRSPGAR
jgi:hypothetical protein